MELLKTLFVTLLKIVDGKQLISVLLKTKVINTMLYMIKTYPFCNISSQQALEILNALKESFDVEDIATLKAFIMVELEGQKDFNFPSGYKTSGVNMGQITKMAIELRIMTQAALNDESSDGDFDEEDMPEDQRVKREQTGEWLRFCKEKIEKIEKVWNRKLEESSTGEDDDDEHSGQADNKSQEDEDDNLSQEDTISRILDQNVGGRFGGGVLSRSNVERVKSDAVTKDLQAAKESLAAQA